MDNKRFFFFKKFPNVAPQPFGNVQRSDKPAVVSSPEGPNHSGTRRCLDGAGRTGYLRREHPAPCIPGAHACYACGTGNTCTVDRR